MDGIVVLGFVLGVAAVVVLAIAPLFMPWRAHARWLVSAQALDPARSWPTAPWELRAVRIASITRCGNDVEVGVLEHGARLPSLIEGRSLDRDAFATLQRWCARETPLVLVLGVGSAVHLHDDATSVSGLQAKSRDHVATTALRAVR
jgi:hypothetical protein